MIKFNKKGIWFHLKGDDICLIWFWSKVAGRYYSEKFNRNFLSLIEYFKHIGIPSSFYSKSIVGFTYVDIIKEWVSTNFSKDIIIVLLDINFSKKPPAFWEGIPYTKKVVFTKEVVILKCKDYGQMNRIIDSIEKEFAIAMGFKGGVLMCDNEYKDLTNNNDN